MACDHACVGLPSSSAANSDPVVADWFDHRRTTALRQWLSPALEPIAVSGLLRQVIEGWIRQQLAFDAPWSALEREQAGQANLDDYLKKRDPGKFGLNEARLLQHLATGEGCRLWARQQWQGQLQSLFLARKSDLDLASCGLIRLGNEAFAQELYFRIISGEAGFESLARLHSEGPEQQAGGHLPLQPVSRLPMGLPALVQTLKPGELTRPLPLGEQWALVKLIELVPARFDDQKVQEQLLSDQLVSWLSEAVDYAIALLLLPPDRDQAVLAHAHA